jgi:hypothetical protein
MMHALYWLNRLLLVILTESLPYETADIVLAAKNFSGCDMNKAVHLRGCDPREDHG